MAAQASKNFADSIFARLIALCLAVAIGYFLYTNYKDDFNRLLDGNTETGLPVTSPSTTPDEAADPALAECLQERIGDVERMKDEGILSDAQYTQFRSRAEELCYQQNPG